MTKTLECEACKAKQACIDSLLATFHEAPDDEWKKDAITRAIKAMNHPSSSMTITEKCRRHNIPPSTYYWRIQHGWDEIRALTTPPDKKHDHRVKRIT